MRQNPTKKPKVKLIDHDILNFPPFSSQKVTRSDGSRQDQKGHTNQQKGRTSVHQNMNFQKGHVCWELILADF